MVTDWMMPDVDGIQLIKLMRTKIKLTPPIMMITALSSKEAHDHALDSGADDFIGKPFDSVEVVSRLNSLLARSSQTAVSAPAVIRKQVPGRTPISHPRGGKQVMVAVAASTGGPPVLKDFLKKIRSSKRATIMVVQHGPKWMFESFASSLSKVTNIPVHLVTEEMPLEVGNIYLASGNGHMVVDPSGRKVQVEDGTDINYVKPAADPLFESVANTFGENAIGVVFTGMGSDAAYGCRAIAEQGGHVLVQEPETCAVASMPEAVSKVGVTPLIVSDTEMHKAVAKIVQEIVKDVSSV
ncbi:MAG: chemotaxis protein CheB [Candidatus Scalindua sp.]|nr:chemotaxis protein CheB [Candidatus Scalindua sp.]MDV5167323.1 chemotaxis protein CheB [Candidatus Scalindua sp.]